MTTDCILDNNGWILRASHFQLLSYEIVLVVASSTWNYSPHNTTQLALRVYMYVFIHLALAS